MKPLGWTLLTAAMLAAAPAAATPCSVKSPAHAVALVELYTSEGCSSCPPADRWLSSLRDSFGADQLVPLALHVDYWNYLGWNDPFSQAQFSVRQREIAQLNRQRVVYTPQVTLQGEDYRGWGSGRFADAVRAINQQPARAELNLSLGVAQDAVTLVLKGGVSDASARPAAQVFMALYENQLSTRVPAGENAGRTLRHDHVVRVWLGPFQVGSDGRIDLSRAVTFDKNWNSTQLGAAAFVQDARSGDVLQAVALPACRG
jgi:hypothetical protein